MAIFYLETKFRHFTPETAVFNEAVRQHNWLHPDSRMDAIYDQGPDSSMCMRAVSIAQSRGVENVIPVGSIEFVQNYCEQLFGANTPMVKALNVPPELRKKGLLLRDVWDVNSATELESIYEQNREWC